MSGNAMSLAKMSETEQANIHFEAHLLELEEAGDSWNAARAPVPANACGGWELKIS